MSRKRELDQAHQPIEESRAVLGGYDAATDRIVELLRRRAAAAYEFLNILEAHAEPIAYEESLAAWRKEADNGVADAFVGEALLDRLTFEDGGVAALYIVGTCKEFADKEHGGATIERQLPVLYRAIARDSNFGQLLASYVAKVRRRDEPREPGPCPHCHPEEADSMSDSAFEKRLYGALCREPVFLALRSQFVVSRCDKLMRISLNN